jgi:diguanylate cyclase (GGDEF)-like protein/PAS domain S-box-containing protein
VSTADDGWALDADRLPLGMLREVTDLVVVFDHDGSILWATPFTLSLLGYDDVDDLSVVGRNITEFVHPDDMLRAAEVMEMMVDDSIPVPVTPALYRLQRLDGTWVPVELNGAVLTTVDGEDELLAILGRYSGDRDVQDRILERLTSGTGPTAAIDLVPEFGLWRHPHELYAVWYADDEGRRVMTGSTDAVELAALAHGTESPWDTVAETGEELIGSLDRLAEPLRSAAAAKGFGTCWAVPVPDPLHTEPAVVLVWTTADDHHALAHRFALEMMETSLTLILQWRAQVAALEEAARRDPLTGTANRARLFDLLDQLAKTEDDRGALVGFLYVDLDSFKEVNDVYGHSSGDAVLCEVVRRITNGLRPGDVLARLGGDEFAVVCPGLRDEQTAAVALTSIAERIIEAVRVPMRIGSTEVSVGASIGIAITDSGSLVPDALIDRADQALYEAKTSGRGRWHVSEGTPT